MFPSRLDQKLPLTYDVDISYSDPAGRPYSERTVLDLSTYIGTGGVTRQGLHDIHKRLEEISKSLKRWTDWEGLKIVTRADRKQRAAERDEREGEREVP